MPRFSVAFTRRKSTADQIDDVSAVVGSSFRVLERSEVVAAGKGFDGGKRLAVKQASIMMEHPTEDNVFADVKDNRESASSNTKGTITGCSRDSDASTAHSLTECNHATHDARLGCNMTIPDQPIPPILKPSSSGFFKSAGQTFSLGTPKKNQAPALPPEDLGETRQPDAEFAQTRASDRFREQDGRKRVATNSLNKIVAPPHVHDVKMDELDGDFGNIFNGYDENRRSTANHSPPPQMRSLTSNRAQAPSPIRIDRTTKFEAPPSSWTSQHSDEELMANSKSFATLTNEMGPPPVPQQAHKLLPGQSQPSPSFSRYSTSPQPSPQSSSIAGTEDEDVGFLRDEFSHVRNYMAADAETASTACYRRDQPSRPRHEDRGVAKDEVNLLGSGASLCSSASRAAQRRRAGRTARAQNKIMTPAEFERYRRDKEGEKKKNLGEVSDVVKVEEDADNYEDDEDELDRAKQAAKQREKQEAHMSVYRQQMMKVTGETASLTRSQTNLAASLSTLNFSTKFAGSTQGPSAAQTTNMSDASDDEEVPLAILAAHGFPNKNRPPTRLSVMSSNPNLRAVGQVSYQRPTSALEGAGSHGHLPAFAKGLPEDPYLGASLVCNPVRESLALGGGVAYPAPALGLMPPAGLVGVIGSEERARAKRRGDLHTDHQTYAPPFAGMGGFMPQRTMYTQQASREQAQLQMKQQIHHLMQMQMQFMQMMAGQNSNSLTSASMTDLGVGGPTAAMGGASAIRTPETMRHSFVGIESVPHLPRIDTHNRTKSMMQPGSAPWVQTAQSAGAYIQGSVYAPSIAPSERSNIGLPGRYRAVSQMPPVPGLKHVRQYSSMSGTSGLYQTGKPCRIAMVASPEQSDDEDDEKGWEVMRAERENKKSTWKPIKDMPPEFSALIT